MTAIQRFGAEPGLQDLNLHFHIVHLDGVFDRGADEALHSFQHTPTTEDIEGLVVEIGLACERWLARQAFAGEVEDRADTPGARWARRQRGPGPPLRWTGRCRVAQGGRPRDPVPKVPSSTEAEREARASLRLAKRAEKRGRDKAAKAPPGWAELLKRVFGVDGWECPDCGKRMRLRTVVVGPPTSTTIVTGLLRSTGPPTPRRGGDDQGVHAGA